MIHIPICGSTKGGWTRYYREEVANALDITQKSTDMNEIIKQYRIVTDYTQQEVPMISAYIISALGAVNDRLENAVPDDMVPLSMFMNGELQDKFLEVKDGVIIKGKGSYDNLYR